MPPSATPNEFLFKTTLNIMRFYITISMIEIFYQWDGGLVVTQKDWFFCVPGSIFYWNERLFFKSEYQKS